MNLPFDLSENIYTHTHNLSHSHTHTHSSITDPSHFLFLFFLNLFANFFSPPRWLNFFFLFSCFHFFVNISCFASCWAVLFCIFRRDVAEVSRCEEEEHSFFQEHSSRVRNCHHYCYRYRYRYLYLYRHFI